MPFHDKTFDVVYCQLGLQFFPERPAALREMHRVMVAGGRVGLMVWQDIKFAPGFNALAAALARNVSAEAASIMRAPFALANSEHLSAIVAEQAFGDIKIDSVAGGVHFPSVSRGGGLCVTDPVAGPVVLALK